MSLVALVDSCQIGSSIRAKPPRLDMDTEEHKEGGLFDETSDYDDDDEEEEEFAPGKRSLTKQDSNFDGDRETSLDSLKDKDETQ